MKTYRDYSAMHHHPHRVSLATTRRAWAAITRRPASSLRELARELRVSVTTARMALYRLEEIGYIASTSRHGRQRNSRAWQIIVPLYEMKESPQCTA